MSRGKFWKLAKRLWLVLRSLSEREKLIAIYCMTEQTNRIGFYPLSSAKAADDLGLSRRAFEISLHRVCDALGWQFDPAARVLFLTDWWRYNDPGNRDALTAFLQDLLDVPPTPLLRQFLIQTTDLSDDLRQVFHEAVEALRLPPFPPGCGAPCPPGPTQGEDQGGGDNRLDLTKQHVDETAPALSSFVWKEGFGRFWEAYPKKIGNGSVEGWFKQYRPNDELAQRMIGKLTEMKQSKSWQEADGKYIPAPITWLEEKRWNDEVEVRGLPPKKRIIYT